MLDNTLECRVFSFLKFIITHLCIQVSDSDKLSMRIQGLKSGNVVVSVKVTVPRSVVPIDHVGRFTDSISINIFEDLQVVNYPTSPMLLAPEMKYQLRTNKDEVSISLSVMRDNFICFLGIIFCVYRWLVLDI